MTSFTVAVFPVTWLAAMEPAEDRPDDFSVSTGNSNPIVAAMEPAEDRPDDDSHALTVAHQVVAAAMEPAEDRPDDVIFPPPASFADFGRNGAGRGSAG